jgi:excisionase family DNA binding protein
MIDDTRMLTVPDVMARTGLARHQVYQLINMRRLESIRIGRCRRVPIAAVDRLVESHDSKDGV